jgi:uncharacterized protein (TIGR02996 family)
MATAGQERAAFVAALMRGEDVAGVFADWLDEHGEPKAAAALRRPGGFPVVALRGADFAGAGFALFWARDEVVLLGDVSCPCGAPAWHYRYRRYLCPACNEEARRQRGRA